MDKLQINGPVILEGNIDISGAKNSILPILCASILADSPSKFYNVPNLRDVKTLCKILNSLGVETTYNNNTLTVNPANISSNEATYDYVKEMRASICLLGPLLARFGETKISLPGGCVIGPRPVDIHLKGLTEIGAECYIKHGYIHIKGPLKGGEVFLGGRFGSSVTATANLIMASIFCDNEVIIESAAMEPEIQDLASYLNKMGAKINGIGSHAIHIKGVKKLTGCEHTIIPDRIEAGTFMIAAAMTKGELFLKNARPRHLSALIYKLKETGASIRDSADGIHIKAVKSPVPLDIITLPFPGYPTDLQAQIMSLLSVADGISVVTEKVYPERFMHISELNRMGANITLEGSTAVIKGVNNLSGAEVMASDLRASAGLVLAGLIAHGSTTIHRVYHIDRGYDKIEQKLSAVGANITRLKE